MKNCLITILLFVVTLPLINLQSQDLHFSQSDLNSTFRNPASMGQGHCTNQLMASYRSQWSTIPSAYRNIALAFQQKIKNLSWGTSILHNDAGKASLRTTQMMLDFSYRKKISGVDEYLSIGVSGGIIQQRFQPEFFQFDRQYVEGVGFDNSISNGESLLRTSQFLPTITVGAFINKNLNRLNLKGGISFAHLNAPQVQFYEGSKETYPMRTSIFAKVQIPFRPNLKGEIQGAWNQQSIASEKIIGARVLYQLNSENWLTIGLANRLKDAFILEGGLKLKNSSFAISYDLNNSRLNSVTNSKGAIELSMTYCFDIKENFQQKKYIRPIQIKESHPTGGLQNENDRDGDGIPDNIDECPTIPGRLHLKGCNDTDQDGVWDSIDACPHLFGEKNNQGCPTNSLDTDKDGLIDEVDKCPFLKGKAALGGCPDSDNDGLSDLEDYCPFLKGKKENNGCPQMNQKEHQEFVKNKTISAIVEFDTDRSEIKSYFDQQLEEVVNFMLENPKATAFITGHTDDEGDAAYNFELGDRRAKEVMNYLVERGVQIQNLSTISYGETKPIRANRSAYEKARNRRVEVKVYLR